MYIPDWIGDITTIAFDYGGTLTVPRELQGGPVDETVTQPVDPLAADALRALHARRFRMVLACNTVPQRPRGAALVAAGVADLFTDVIESHVLGYAKPDPEFFLAVAVVADAKPHQILYVGDRLDTDVIASMAFGMRSAAVARTGHVRLPDGAVRIHHVHDLLELLPEAGPQ